MSSDTVYSELVFALSGEDKSAYEFGDFFDLVSDCVDNPDDTTKRAIAFATALVLKDERLDILDGSVLEGQTWANAKAGYTAIMADIKVDSPTAGYSLWYHEKEDIIIFQYNFFK